MGSASGVPGRRPAQLSRILASASLGTSSISRLVQALDGGEVRAFVESGFFYGGADEQAAVAARDEICLRRPDDMLQQVREGMTRQSIWPLTGRVGKAWAGFGLTMLRRS